jgi:hypothetical protein
MSKFEIIQIKGAIIDQFSENMFKCRHVLILVRAITESIQVNDEMLK